MSNFEQMEKVLAEMKAGFTTVNNLTFKRIDVVDSGGSKATFYFDRSGNYVLDVPIEWVTDEIN